MNEIEKMYENAGVKSFKTCEFCTQKSIDCLKENISNITCGFASDMYPPFTAEKQIELIKWLIQKYKDISIQHKLNLFYINIQDIYIGMVHIEFDETIAGLINNLWQSLTEEEKQQVKGILE